MKRDARFYFANLGADVMRCINAVEIGDEIRYKNSLARAYRTLSFMRGAQCPEAHEEGLLLLRGVQLGKEDGVLVSQKGSFAKLFSRTDYLTKELMKGVNEKV
ncbi:MAG: hypothetical protein AAB421_00030 [Patescibacteria group bacterium]